MPPNWRCSSRYRGQVPDEVFGEPYLPPVTDGSGEDRRWLHHGAKLLNDAGIVLKNGKRVLPDGTTITIEFLLDEPGLNPHTLPYIRNLGILGIAGDAAHGRSGAIPRPRR